MIYDVIIGVDPGVTGGISIIEKNKKPTVYDIPIFKKEVNKKKKSFYDREKIVEILDKYQNKDVLFVQEKVSAMPGQGVTSSFNFGVSSECTIAMAYAFKFDVVEVRPSEWKKYYMNDLETDKIKQYREKIKVYKEKIKNDKQKKEKIDKKENDNIKIYKKEINKIKRIIKKEAKNAARELASHKYPSMKNKFKLVKNDGVAESLLIALYGKERYQSK